MLREEIALALDGWEDGWASKLLRFLTALGVDVWEGLPRGQSVLHGDVGEGSPLRKCNDPCTSRGLKGQQSHCKKRVLTWTESKNA